jgi:glycosyltransferase involved in cell wall biosynthesis
MRIVQVISRYNVGGTAKWLKILIDGLVEQGHEVFLIIGEVNSGEKEEKNLPNCKLIRIEGLGKGGSIFSTLKAFRTLRLTLLDLNPAIVNSHTSKAGVLTRCLRIFGLCRKIKFVHTYHGHLLYGYFPSYIVNMIVFVERILSGKNFGLISAGQQVKNELLERKVGQNAAFKVIPIGVPNLNFIDKSSSRKMFDIGQDFFVVGWLGRLAPIKRPDLLLQIASKMPDTLFLVGGDGDLMGEMLSAKLPNVQLLGWVSPEDFWPACDLALLTSDNEAMPISLIEAGQCELPVVASRVGSIEDLISDSYSGYLCSNLEEFVERIELLKGDPRLRTDLASKFNQEISLKYASSRFLNEHISFYKSFTN